MKKVTYGVDHLIDWNARIPVGKACMSVHFTGGALTKYGVTPAEFTTTDPFTQRVIEDSEYFRSGRITILRSAGSPDVQAVSPVSATDTPPGEHDVVEVACVEDAIEYLRANFEVPSYRVRNMAVAQEIAASHGVRFLLSGSIGQ